MGLILCKGTYEQVIALRAVETTGGDFSKFSVRQSKSHYILTIKQIS